MQKTQIFHFEFGCKLPLTLSNEMFLSSEEQVIHIENQDQGLVLHNLYIKVGVSYVLGKSKTLEIAVYSSVLGPWSLLKPIQSFLELTHMGLPPMQLKSFRLFNVDLFLNLPIEEGNLHIHLMKLPA